MKPASTKPSGILLLLEGPLQSWGTQSRFGHRDTDFEPSKSGVLGLVGAALGMQRDDGDTLAKLRELTMAVRVDREGSVLRDYHTAGGGVFRGQPHRVYGTGTVVTERFYLTNACFVVALSGSDREFVARAARALQRPKWPLFLGRRSCVPTRPVFLAGPQDGEVWGLLRSVPLQVKPPAPGDSIRCVVEAAGGKPRNDVPTSFAMYDRAFATRFVQDQWLSPSDLPGEPDAPQSLAAQSTIE